MKRVVVQTRVTGSGVLLLDIQIIVGFSVAYNIQTENNKIKMKL
jgi:hypothetical protein